MLSPEEYARLRQVYERIADRMIPNATPEHRAYMLSPAMIEQHEVLGRALVGHDYASEAEAEDVRRMDEGDCNA